jgi:hypothetical protein
MPEHIGKTIVPPYQQAERLERGCGLESESMRNSGVESLVTISGNHTNGLCWSLTLQKTNDTAYVATVTADSIDAPYITTLRAEEHQETACRCVNFDPGRRDLLFCVHENSIPQELILFATQATTRRK